MASETISHTVPAPQAPKEPIPRAAPARQAPEIPPEAPDIQEWQSKCHKWVDRTTRILRVFNRVGIRATVTSWMSPGIRQNQNEIWHVVHADDDEEDLDQVGIEAGIRALEISTEVEEGPAPAGMEGACSQVPAMESVSRAEQADMAEAV